MQSLRQTFGPRTATLHLFKAYEKPWGCLKMIYEDHEEQPSFWRKAVGKAG